MDVRDLLDVAYSLFTEWSCLHQSQVEQIESINRYFRDRETEYETGELVLPGWASVGNAAAQYGPADAADPFATAPDTPSE